MEKKYSAFVPLSIPVTPDAGELLLRQVHYWKETYGFTDFLFFGPSLGYRVNGFPPLSEFERIGEILKSLKEQTKDLGVRIGWWILLTLKCGRLPGATPMIDGDGNPSPVSNCPLDPLFIETYAKSVARTVEIAPPIIFAPRTISRSTLPSASADASAHITLRRTRRKPARPTTAPRFSKPSPPPVPREIPCGR